MRRAGPSAHAPNGFVLAARYASRMLPEIFRLDDVLLDVEFPVNDRLPLEKLLASLPSPGLHRRRQPRLGLPVLADQEEGRSQQERPEDRRPHAACRHAAFHRALHGGVPAAQHDRRMVVWPARHRRDLPAARASPPASRPSRCPTCAGEMTAHPRRAHSTAGPRLSNNSPCSTPAAAAATSSSPRFTCSCLCECTTKGCPLETPSTPCWPRTSSAWKLTRAARRSPHSPWRLAAWKYPGEDGQPLGYRSLPPLNIACSGQGVVGTKEQWTRFANGDSRFEEGMERLYDLFQKAPTLGSLIDPRTVGEDLFALGFDVLQGALDRTLKKNDVLADPDREALGIAAQGIALAASLMAREFTLVATNVPYLARGKHGGELREHIEHAHPSAKADLATAFVERSLACCESGGSAALVTPHNWFYQSTYKQLRARVLQAATWNIAARLGPRAFETISGEMVNVALLAITQQAPSPGQIYAGLDAGQEEGPPEKADALLRSLISLVRQDRQAINPDGRIIVSGAAPDRPVAPLSSYCSSILGLGTGDYAHYGRAFWELPCFGEQWTAHQSTVEEPAPYGGRHYLVAWDHRENRVRGLTRAEREQIHNQDQSGQQAWGKRGVAVGLMHDLKPTLYTGERFEKMLAVILPAQPEILPALWSYCNSPLFAKAVRELDNGVVVANGTLVKIPFDLDYWQRVAAERYPDGLPKPNSNDPTQWLLDGQPAGSDDPLQVGVARLSGYRWPRQTGSSFPDCPAIGTDRLDALADKDGIVPIPATRGEPPASDRLRELLRSAFGSQWSTPLEDNLLSNAGAKPGTSLDDWLRTQFFEHHCKRFHNRPFIWHIWDGRKDGFSCLVNYHKLDHALLETLTYSYVQDWFSAQAAAAKSNQTGADLRLAPPRNCNKS